MSPPARRLLLRILGLRDRGRGSERGSEPGSEPGSVEEATRDERPDEEPAGSPPTDSWARELVESLDEECRRVAAREGEGAAARWYLRQVLSPRTLHFALLLRKRRRRARKREEGWEMRDASTGRWWEGTALDLRQTARGLFREPRLAVFVAGTLALGIGATAALFGVADRLFLRGIEHVERPEELARVYLGFDGSDGREARTTPLVPWLTVRAIREEVSSFQALAPYHFQEVLVEVGAVVRRLRVGVAGDGFFELLGTAPAQGRFFAGESDAAGGDLAVLSWNLWMAAFDGDPDAVGRTFTFRGRPHTIVGIAPRGFAGPHLRPVDLWVPVDPERTGNRNWQVVVRLQGGRPNSAAMERIAADADAVHRRTDPGRFYQWAVPGRILAAPVTSDDSGEEPAELAVARMLFGVGSLILLIGMANVVNLLLARLTRRRREVAVRVALGAGRGRLVRLHVLESVILAALGGLVALPVAWGAGLVLRDVLLPDVAWSAPPLSWRVVAVGSLVTLLTGLLVAVVPAWQAIRRNVSRDLRSQGASHGRRRSRIHVGLAAAQVTFATFLLIGAGLFLRSFLVLRATDLGVDASAVTVFTLASLDPTGLPSASVREQELYLRALAAIREDAAVETAALSLGLPFMYNFGRSVSVPGVDSVPELPGGGPYLSAVTAGYFETVGTSLVRGRAFTAAEVAGDEPVIVVSESMAAALWPGADPLGACVRVGSAEDPCSRVVGVAEDVHRVGYREPPSMQYYLPLGPPGGFGGMALVIRMRTGDGADVDRIRRALASLDPAVDHVEAVRLQSLLEPQVRPWRLGASVLGLAALLALLVSLAGVYGVLSYLVEQRRKEIGVRMALGASVTRIGGLVVWTGLLATAAGLVSGVLLVAGGARWIEPLLMETSVLDPTVLSSTMAILLLAAVLACLLPALRACRVDPARSLSAE